MNNPTEELPFKEETLSHPKNTGIITRIISWGALPVSGILQTLTLAPYNQWWLGPIAIALLLWGIYNTGESPVSRGFLKGWLLGIGLMGSGVSWIYVSIHDYGYASPLLASFLTAGFVAGIAIFHGLAIWTFSRFLHHSPLRDAISFAALWVLSDWFRSWFLTGFPWLYLGYAHLQTPLAGWAPVLGIFGLNYLVALTGSTLWLAYVVFVNRQQALLRPLVYLTSAVFALWLLGFGLKGHPWTQKIADDPLQVAMVQINIPQELKWLPSQRKITLDLFEQLTAEHWGKQLILWPETAIPMLLDQAMPYIDRMSRLAKASHSSLITGIPSREKLIDPETKRRRYIIHNSILASGDGEGLYHKQKLVPFGEYVPLEDLLRGLIRFFDLPMSNFRPGAANQALLKTGNYLTAPFICYEIVYPDFVASRSRDTHYLITISNDSWFGHSIGPLQHLQMAQMRALETGRFVLRDTNNGISAIIAPDGQIQAQSKQFERTVLSGNIYPVSGSTPFMLTGSWPILLWCAVIAIFIGWQRSPS